MMPQNLDLMLSVSKNYQKVSLSADLRFYLEELNIFYNCFKM